MSKTIAIANQKGGTGKTTTTLNLGAALAERNKRVLLVDFDPQAALTLAHAIDPFRLERTVYQALVDPDTLMGDVLISCSNPGRASDLAPSNLDLSGVEVELLGEIARETFLRDALAPIKANYDFILIDCPPSLGLLTINAFSAADELLVPVQVQFFALRALEQLFGLAHRVKAKANPELQIAGLLPTMYETRTRHSREVVEELRSVFPDQVYDIVIKKTIKFPDSVIVSTEDFDQPPEPRSILAFDPKSEHAQAYRKLAREVLL